MPDSPARSLTPFGWRLGLLAALAMAFLSLIPQAHLWYKRGADWQGTYAYLYSDEPAYAAYTNALVDGRPRLNDPFAGRDAAPGAPLPESAYTIQFIPTYMLALPARALGLSTNTMFILLMPLVAVGASLAVFRLVALVTGDVRVAAAAVPFTLCFAILISGQGLVVNLTGGVPAYVFLPFLRRYVPGMPFVFFLLFCVLLWRALVGATRRVRLVCGVLGGVLFALLVYSYFYHWTAAAALLACVALLWLGARPDNWRAALAPLAVIAVSGVAALIPYAILLSRRAPTMDTVQALTYSRAPDLWRGVVLVAVLVLVALVYGVRRRWLNSRSPAMLFNAALVLMVLAVFNQQIITGHSLQPMHYEQYIGNYVVLLSAAIAAGLLWHGRTAATAAAAAATGASLQAASHPALPPAATTTTTTTKQLLAHRIWLPLALISLLWGAGESLMATRQAAASNLQRDEWGAVTRRLRERAGEIPRAPSAPYPVVFHQGLSRADNIPAATPFAVVWTQHIFVFSGVTAEEHRERVFRYLYFCGIAPERFAADNRDRGFIQFALFGWERANPRLTVNPTPVTPEEIKREGRAYADYVSSFTQATAARLPLSYVVVSDDQPLDFSNLDRWYARDAGERIGRHIIYRVKLRN